MCKTLNLVPIKIPDNKSDCVVHYQRHDKSLFESTHNMSKGDTVGIGLEFFGKKNG